MILVARLEAAQHIAAGLGGIAAATAGTAPDHLLEKGGLEFSSVHHRPRARDREARAGDELSCFNKCFAKLSPLALLVWK